MTDKRKVRPGSDAAEDAPEAAGREAPRAESAEGEELPVEVGTVPEPAAAGVSGVPMEPSSERIRRLEEELEEARDRHLRLAAEFDNFRKRVARERIELVDRAQAQFVLKMLDVLDDLDRLVAGEAGAGSDRVIYDGTVLINRKLRKELEAAGLEQVDPAGAPFDPALHEAVSAVPPPDPSRDHTVAATFQTGYRFKGQLIRPARVQVYSDPGAV